MKGFENVTIVGAGFSGLIAATQLRGARIVEVQKEPSQNHHAVLRFRSDIVSRATQIPFREVLVHKGIFVGGQFHSVCSPAMANMYSRKVVGRIADRSIWDLRSVNRFIAPPSFYEELIDRVGSRIQWESSVDFSLGSDPIISTIPMKDAASQCGVDTGQIEFEVSSIVVMAATIN